MKCALCKKEKKTVSLQPTVHQLIFGGFPVRMKPICQACGTKQAKKIEKLLP